MSADFPMTAASDVKQHLYDLFLSAIARIAPDETDLAFGLERPKQAAHGDFACNAAMLLSKRLRRNPREIAADLQSALADSPWIARSEVAGAGFVNIYLAPAAKQESGRRILADGAGGGRPNVGGGKRVQVEFVSANPTGPLHVGHGRGAAYGASLANILSAAGFVVEREYYVNDAGRQMDILALSTWLRYLELHGEAVAFPPNAYQGDYVVNMARSIAAVHGNKFLRSFAVVAEGITALDADKEAHLDDLISAAKRLLDEDYAYIHQFALAEQLGDCRDDLMEFGVHFEHWFSEKSLFDTGLVDKAVARLEERGHVYLQDGAKWFRSTQFGDEKDRVVQRENGAYTYFASDIAYHLNKFERGFDRIIDIWGADHHGYIPRVNGAITALGLDPTRLEVALVQFAVLYRNGEKASMSTRAGDFVTLRELRREVGNDAARFFYILRKSDNHLDFDLDLAKKQSNDNPVYYIQYAHARICSVLREAACVESDLVAADLSMLETDAALILLQRLGEYPEAVAAAARELAPHVVAYYLKDVAADYHSFYNADRILVDDAELRYARLALCLATRRILADGLAQLGVSAPESM